MVAALYVDAERGPYAALPGVDVWGEERDARLYAGPWPVVAHPPCGPWGRLAHLCTEQDPELALRAVEQVRRWGGVLEHPAGSRLWSAAGLPLPGEPERDGSLMRVLNSPLRPLPFHLHRLCRTDPARLAAEAARDRGLPSPPARAPRLRAGKPGKRGRTPKQQKQRERGNRSWRERLRRAFGRFVGA